MYMRFEFVLDTNSDDVDYETQRALSLAKRIYGQDKVYEWTYLETLPYDYQPPLGFASAESA